MEIARATEGAYDQGDAARFTGEVSLRSTLRADDGTNIGVVHFAPGRADTLAPPRRGQFLYAVTGRGRVRSRGEPGHVLEPGDVIHVAPGEWHFHGGTPDAPLVHVAINGGGDAIWGDPVSEAEYDEGF